MKLRMGEAFFLWIKNIHVQYTRTDTGRKCIFQLVRLVGVVRVVKQWFTSRRDSELHIISETARCELTTHMTRTTRTGSELHIISKKAWEHEHAEHNV